MSARHEIAVLGRRAGLTGPEAEQVADQFYARALRDAAHLFEEYGRSRLDGGIMAAADAAALLRQRAAEQGETVAREEECTP